MRITILGKRWQLRFVPNLGDKLGDCSDPARPHREIRIAQGLRGETKLEVLIHEFLHASSWEWSEEHVAHVASDIARTLRRLGYRCEGEVEDQP